MTARDLLAPCLGAALLGGMLVQACEARVAVTSQSTDSLPPMHRSRIPDSVPGPVEHVRGFRIFQAGDCTVWRFQDSVGVHYLAEGRFAGSGALGCSVAPMTKRLAKKRAATIVTRMLSIPMALDHAKPTFFQCDRGAQRHALCWVLSRQLRVPPSQARRATAGWERVASWPTHVARVVVATIGRSDG